MDKEKDILKLEKLVSALYLVTNSFSDSEPIKWRLRDLGLSLLSHITPPSYSLGQLLSPMEQVIALCDIARLNSGASQMNFEIIKQEFSSLRDRLSLREKTEFPANLPSLSLPNMTNSYRSNQPTLPQRSMGATKTRENGSIGTSNSNNRQELIYRIIKQSGPLSIKDIAQNVPGVSSKTVQRELVSLVQSGRLKREGDRRWSRYSAV
jgi:hypothetical protein